MFNLENVDFLYFETAPTLKPLVGGHGVRFVGIKLKNEETSHAKCHVLRTNTTVT